MSTQTITRAKPFISLILFIASLAYAEEWKVDFSRRLPQIKEEKKLENPEEQKSQGASFVDALFSDSPPALEVVVLHTEKGFIPSQIRVKQGQTYTLYVVNVNENEKNVSFVLDSFSEHHATYYGKIKSFTIRPQKEGVYRFVSPETSAQGKLVVVPDDKNNRFPSSE